MSYTYTKSANLILGCILFWLYKIKVLEIQINFNMT